MLNVIGTLLTRSIRNTVFKVSIETIVTLFSHVSGMINPIINSAGIISNIADKTLPARIRHVFDSVLSQTNSTVIFLDPSAIAGNATAKRGKQIKRLIIMLIIIISPINGIPIPGNNNPSATAAITAQKNIRSKSFRQFHTGLLKQI